MTPPLPDGATLRAWRVEGRVQGVGFRWSTVRVARDLGLRGRVWNRVDGSVEVHASGSTAELDRLGSWLARGPGGARVTALVEIPAGPEASASGFHALL